jgi:hypothetical protein
MLKNSNDGIQDRYNENDVDLRPKMRRMKEVYSEDQIGSMNAPDLGVLGGGFVGEVLGRRGRAAIVRPLHVRLEPKRSNFDRKAPEYRSAAHCSKRRGGAMQLGGGRRINW